MFSTFLRPGIAAIAVFLISFVVYLLTMDPGLGFIDSGELAAVCSQLGIAHPTGYPLFTLVGWLFSKLPIATTEIVRLNIMAAFFTAAAAGVVVMLGHELSANWWSPKKKEVPVQKGKKKQEEELPIAHDGSMSTLIGLVAGLIAAFSLTWWQQANSLEVYSLHLLLITLAIFYFLRMLRKEEGVVGRDGLLFAIMLGLAFTNHLTSILLAPGMLYAYFARYGLNGASFKRIVKLAVPFVAMLLIYLYLPLRAAADPVLNWGDPSDMKQFIKHITGGQYKIWMFTGNSAGANWGMFWSGLTDQFSLPVILLALAGIPALLSRGKQHRVNLLVLFLLFFFGCLFYAINYDINDIQSYFLLSYLSIAVVAALGLGWTIEQFLNTEIKTRTAALLGVGLIAIGFEFGTNMSQADESENYLVEDYTRNLLVNLPPNAIIFSTQWDFWVSGALYYQLVEGLRPDVVVIDKHLMRDRPWYFAHLRQRAPDVMKRVEAETNNFLKYLVAFDRDEPFDEQAIGGAYQEFTKALIEKNRDRPLYMTTELIEERDDLLQTGVQPQAGGVALTLNAIPILDGVPHIVNRSKAYEKRGYYPDNLRRLQAAPLALTASKLAEEGKAQLAQKYFDLALQLKPTAIASYEELPEKERDFVARVDQAFADIERLRASVLAPR